MRNSTSKLKRSHTMFTLEDRSRLCDALIATARTDGRITSAALTGSTALGTGDRWSDIDLAFGTTAETDIGQVVADWTDRMYREHGAIHHVDLRFGNVLFRVFLLGSTLQVDLAFWPAAGFGPIGPAFRLLFGSANEKRELPPPAAADLIGMAWLHALHARSSISRGRLWQAEYMLSGVRDHVLALACLRHGLPTVHARGIDDLPPEATPAVTGALVRSLEDTELRRAFGVVIDALIAEIERADAGLASRLTRPLRELVQ